MKAPLDKEASKPAPHTVFSAAGAPAPERDRSLDGLRGVASLSVLLLHLSQRLGDVHYSSFSSSLYDQGRKGVSLFFILSALALTMATARRVSAEIHFKRNFYIRRAFRILPLYWIFVLYWGTVHAPAPVSSLAANFGFFFDGLSLDKFHAVSPGIWSLQIEETFYLVFPLLFMRMIDPIQAVCGLCISTIVMFIILRIGLWTGFRSDLSQFLTPFSSHYVFWIGVSLFHLRGSIWFRSLLERIESVGKAWVLDLVAGTALFVTWSQVDWFSNFALSFVVVSSFSSRTLIGRLVRGRLLGLFGKYCYSIYLLHFLILEYLSPTIARCFSWLPAATEGRMLILAPPVMAITLLVGHVSFRLIEQPTINLGARLIGILDRRESGKDA